MSRRGDRGAATVLALAACAVLALLAGVLTEAGVASVTRHRAALAADAAAIAGPGQQLWPRARRRGRR